ncbi:MAG TPA: phosphatidylserine/phosphatidylglycerophosphate/cardiolipin synthase family protein [Mucilaginibacter sp.]|jgi:phosphatidylserine/phosphatidylglycerophosphate/cardiolipin synthase-like enzyme
MSDSQGQSLEDKWNEVLKGGRIKSGNSVSYLIDGWATFESMYQAILTTLTGSTEKYYIYFFGWWLDYNFLLNTPVNQTDKPDPDSSFYNLLKRAVNQKVEVRIMLWDNPLHKGIPVVYPAGVEWQVKHINNLGSIIKKNNDSVAAVADGDNIKFKRTLQSHHQKLLVVNGNEGLVGFCGGLDIAEDRVKTIASHKGSPYHDVHCRIKGDSVTDLIDVFRQRWNASSRVAQLDETKRSLRAPEKPLSEGAREGNQNVCVLRTFLSRQNLCVKEASIGPAILNAIRAAKNSIYIEDQYMINACALGAPGADKDPTSASVAKALGEQLKKLEHITILIPHSAISDLPGVWQARLDFVNKIFENSSVGAEEKTRYSRAFSQEPSLPLKPPFPKLRIFFKYEPPNGYPPLFKKVYQPEDFGPKSYVHAKVWVFDDELAIIGSANCNQRGWNFDSEVAAAIYDHEPDPSYKIPSFAQKLRVKLWAEHLHFSINSAKDQETQIANGIQEKGNCWFTQDARQYVRLYNPVETKDPPLSGNAVSNKEANPAQAPDIFELIGDPNLLTLLKIPKCSINK